MSDALVTELINQKVTQVIENEVLEIIKDTAWLAKVEESISTYARQRILSKFNNAEYTPVLVNAVSESVKRLFKDGFVPDLTSIVDHVDLKTAVDVSVKEMVEATIDNLAVDPNWLAGIQKVINRLATEQVMSKLATFDVNSAVDKAVQDHFQPYVDQIREGLTKPGIEDYAVANELAIFDKHVMVQNHLRVNRDAEIGGDFVVNGNLAVKGFINTDSKSWQTLITAASNRTFELMLEEIQTKLAAELLARISEQGVNLADIRMNNLPVIQNNELTSVITKSKLESVGELTELTVKGQTHLAKTVHIRNSRVGVNTENPETALSVWDDEVSIIVGKRSQNAGMIGTSRKQSLALVVNNQSQLEITADGLTIINQLQIGKHKISHSAVEPGWAGNKGDFVFNTDIKPGSPFAWVCLGQFKWKALKALD